jgi:uncharacterized protein YtpQ (UPF0354 family)
MTPITDQEVSPGGRYRHPLGWYAISIPPGWKIADHAEPVRILASREEAAAVVSISKARPNAPEPPRATLSAVVRDVPGINVIERRNPDEGELRGMRYARIEEIVGEKPPWWAFWRRPRVDAHLLTACYSRGSLLALVTFEARPEYIERHRLAAGALMGSFDLTDNPLPSPEEFLARFLSLARERAPGRKVLPTGQLSVLIDGAPLALDQHYRALTCEPEIGDAVFDRIFAYLTTAEPPSTDVKFDEVKGSILLTIKPREWLDSADRNVPERSRVLRIPFPNETAIVFVVDHAHVMRFVSIEESERWEVPPKEMFRLARENLLRVRPEVTERSVLDPSGKLCAIAITEGDGYDCSRIVLPGLFERCLERFGENFGVAIPNRDFLIAFSLDDDKVVDAVRRRVAEDVVRRPYPISPKFFRLGPEGAVEPL